MSAATPMVLRARECTWVFPRPALVMGILNVTPDSFSDGGRYLEVEAAVERAYHLVDEGAEIIDVGGESTRPNAVAVSEAEELRRVLPVLERLQGRLPAVLSIDTYKPGVAREALRAGACIINDIMSNRTDPEMWHLAAESGAAYVVMHMVGNPRTMQLNPSYRDVCREVGEFFTDRLAALATAGVAREQIALDVGIGFGKRREHNLELLAGLRRFGSLERPQMIGLSRKTFLGRELSPDDRLPAALAASCWAVSSGAQIVRTHDVRATLQAIRIFEEIKNLVEEA